MDRRSFLQTGLCATAAALCPFSASAVAEYKKYEKRIPIGLELYSLRDVINHDTFPKYLKWVAETGFEFVEFAGYHGYDGKELRKLLDDAQVLKPPALISVSIRLKATTLKETLNLRMKSVLNS